MKEEAIDTSTGRRGLGTTLLGLALCALISCAPAFARKPIIAYVPPADGNPAATTGPLTFYDAELATNVPAPALTVAILGAIPRFSVSLHGRYVVYDDPTPQVRLFDRATGSEVPLPGLEGEAPRALSVSDTGLIAYDDNNNGPAQLYDSVTKSAVDPNLTPDDATPTNGHRQSHLSGDGRFLATSCLTHCVKTDTGDDSDPDLYVQDLTTSPPSDTAFPDSLAGTAKNDEHPCISSDGSLVGDDIASGGNRDIFLFDRSQSPPAIVDLTGLNGTTDDHDCVLSFGGAYVGFYREGVGMKVFERPSASFLDLPQAIVDTSRIWFSTPYTPPEKNPPPPPPDTTPCAHLLQGKSASEHLTGTKLGDRILGGRGNDVISGLEGDDCLYGQSGRDRLKGGPGNDTLKGGKGADRSKGGPGKNKIDGGSGNDRIDSRNGVKEKVRCGKGRDTVRADRKDKLRGCERVRRA
ncbi:MAG: hypothetical protein QOD53_2051 [Thermoleophilaceae bacterium]|nr:hypothetical protein [Thermoleophilaceae bacterium]